MLFRGEHVSTFSTDERRPVEVTMGEEDVPGDEQHCMPREIIFNECGSSKVGDVSEVNVPFFSSGTPLLFPMDPASLDNGLLAKRARPAPSVQSPPPSGWGTESEGADFFHGNMHYGSGGLSHLPWHTGSVGTPDGGVRSLSEIESNFSALTLGQPPFPGAGGFVHTRPLSALHMPAHLARRPRSQSLDVPGREAGGRHASSLGSALVSAASSSPIVQSRKRAHPRSQGAHPLRLASPTFGQASSDFRPSPPLPVSSPPKPAKRPAKPWSPRRAHDDLLEGMMTGQLMNIPKARKPRRARSKTITPNAVHRARESARRSKSAQEAGYFVPRSTSGHFSLTGLPTLRGMQAKRRRKRPAAGRNSERIPRRHTARGTSPSSQSPPPGSSAGSAPDLTFQMDEEKVDSYSATTDESAVDSNSIANSLTSTSSSAVVPPTSSSSNPSRYSFPDIDEVLSVQKKIGEGSFSSVFKARVRNPSYNGPKMVAVKRLKTGANTVRVWKEIQVLRKVGGKSPYVLPLLDVVKGEKQVSLIVPYVRHNRFKKYFKALSVFELRRYMYAMFSAMSALHSENIIHRDIKPSNFLHHRASQSYMLVDFGLADEDYVNGGAKIFHPWDESTLGVAPKRMKPPRAGTRGFRAPEVLMSCFEQTTAVDMWAAGVILLSILSARYPVFNSPDDLTCLAEIACILGTERLRRVGLVLNRKVTFPEEREPQDLERLCASLSSRTEMMQKRFPPEVYLLLGRLLDPNPQTRITAQEALLHPFFGSRSLRINM